MKTSRLFLLIAMISAPLAACTSGAAISIGIDASCAAVSAAYSEYAARRTPTVAAQVAYASVRAICDAPPEQRAALESALADAISNFRRVTK